MRISFYFFNPGKESQYHVHTLRKHDRPKMHLQASGTLPEACHQAGVISINQPSVCSARYLPSRPGSSITRLNNQYFS
ncbi:MAG TPA: hypothetical protein ENK25_01120 [Bacteroidetes bacterium]|nr:hypothetical protein [Bacteroidota bacterium]